MRPLGEPWGLRTSHACCAYRLGPGARANSTPGSKRCWQLSQPDYADLLSLHLGESPPNIHTPGFEHRQRAHHEHADFPSPPPAHTYLGTSADTESTTIMPISPHLASWSATSSACSPQSGCTSIRARVSTPRAFRGGEGEGKGQEEY